MAQKQPPKYSFWRDPKVSKLLYDGIYNSNYLIVYDLETSGLRYREDRIIEIGAIRYLRTGSGYKEAGRLHQMIKLPEYMDLSAEVTELTGITPEELSGAPEEQDVCEDILFFFEDTPVVGYNNSSFDNRFLGQQFYRNGYTFSPQASLDVLDMCRDFIPSSEVENYKLETIANYFELQGESYHSAIFDAEITAQILFKMLERLDGKYNKWHGDERPNIERISYWPPGHRIYVNTSVPCKIYYDIAHRAWFTENPDIDLPWLEKEVHELTGCKSDLDFAAYRNK